MIGTLRTLMQILDLRQAQIERRLGWNESHLSRILSGTAALRFEHVLDIGRAMGLKPQEVLRFAFPDWGEPPSAAGRHVQEITASLARPDAGNRNGMPPSPNGDGRGEQGVNRPTADATTAEA